MALPINIEELLHGQVIEWERLEFKSNWNPEPILHTLCAFANDMNNWGGGYIIVGVAEENGRPILPPEGLNPDQIDGIQKELTNIGHRIHPHYLPIAQPYVFEGQHILVIWAPAGDMRPYSAPASLAQGKQERQYYIRHNANTIQAQGENLRRLQELTARVPFDDRINHEAVLEYLDLGLIRDFLYEVKSSLAEESASLPLASVAKQLAIAKGPDEDLRPVNVGLMFFNKQPDNFFRNAWIEVVLREDEAGKNYSEKYFKGPLHIQLRDALDYLKNQIIEERVSKVSGQAEAHRYYNFPYDALEEALANAVYHKSYELPKPIEVQVWPDRIEVLSFPGPIPPVDAQILAENRRIVARDYRNRRVGDLLKELHLTEGRGTGIPTMRQAMADNGSPEPTLETDDHCTYFLTVLNVHPEWLKKEESSGMSTGQDSEIYYANPHDEEDQSSTDQVPNKYRASTEQVPGKYRASTGQVAQEIQMVVKVVDGEMKRSDIQGLIDINHRDYFMDHFLKPALNEGFLEMTIPEKPKSSKQRYKLTEKGKALKKALENETD